MLPKLTTKGIELMVRAMSGEGIVFTRIVIGNGEVPEDYTQLTGLQNELVAMEISKIIKENQYIILKATMSNNSFDTGFYWTELGVYARDPDGGDDILYAYAHYELSEDEAPVFIPSSTSNLVEITHNVHVFVGELDDVSAILLANAEYASAVAFNNHVKDYRNPHKVSKEDLGLGLLENVLPADMTPLFKADISAITEDSYGILHFPNIIPGEKLGVSLNKIRTGLVAFLRHLRQKNPHRVDPKTIGAANALHSHATGDLVRGVLGVARGGTGGKTTREAKISLGIQAGTGSIEGTAGEATYVEIRFSEPFVAAPYVVVTPTADLDQGVYLSISEVTKNSFSARLYTETSIQALGFNWIAIQ